jgi:uncharacterized membrane protein
VVVAEAVVVAIHSILVMFGLSIYTLDDANLPVALNIIVLVLGLVGVHYRIALPHTSSSAVLGPVEL